MTINTMNARLHGQRLAAATDLVDWLTAGTDYDEMELAQAVTLFVEQAGLCSTGLVPLLTGYLPGALEELQEMEQAREGRAAPESVQ